MTLDLNHFPMGPNLRMFFNALSGDGKSATEPTLGDTALQPDPETFQVFETTFAEKIKSYDINIHPHPTELLDELVAMDLPKSAILFARNVAPDSFRYDFRANLALGICHMLEKEWSEAKKHFEHAIELSPSEPAPYVNMALIGCMEQDLDATQNWCMRGLDQYPNYTRLWEILTQSTSERLQASELTLFLRQVAKDKHSWAGMSLVLELEGSSAQVKLDELKKWHDQGESASEFLVELTALYGVVGQFDQIPALIASAEKSSNTPLPWQLRLHACQAFISLGNGPDAQKNLDLCKKGQPPEEVGEIVKNLENEISELTNSSSNINSNSNSNN